jgi:uncharacterized protein YceK
MKKIALSLLLALTFMMQGCSTLADARKAEGEGVKETYSASYEKNLECYQYGTE